MLAVIWRAESVDALIRDLESMRHRNDDAWRSEAVGSDPLSHLDPIASMPARSARTCSSIIEAPYVDKDIEDARLTSQHASSSSGINRSFPTGYVAASAMSSGNPDDAASVSPAETGDPVNKSVANTGKQGKDQNQKK